MTFNRELAAAALIEAVFTNDDAASSKYGISLRTLRGYRQKLHSDAELAGLFHTKKALFDRAWADDLVKALKGAALFIAEATETARTNEKCKTDPNMIAAMAGALKLCADVHLTSKVLDARLADANRPTNGLSEQVSSPEYAN
jgi:hypothetical protein